MNRSTRLTILFLIVFSGCQFERPETFEYGNWRGDVKRGKQLAFAYGCATCHEITGIVDSPGHVGAPLKNFAKRKYIAGALPNTPANLVRWLVDPQEVEPGTAMPDLGMTKKEAVDIGAFLYSQ